MNQISQDRLYQLQSAGDVPTTETVAAAWLLKRELPELRMQVVNVVNLFTLMSHRDHPHGLNDDDFIGLFTQDRPIIFAFHGYPRLIHEIVYHRPNPSRFHVHGYIEEERTTTPFDMLALNRMSRFHLAIAALRRVGRSCSKGSAVIDKFETHLLDHEAYIRKHDQDMPEILNWRWSEA